MKQRPSTRAAGAPVPRSLPALGSHQLQPRRRRRRARVGRCGRGGGGREHVLARLARALCRALKPVSTPAAPGGCEALRQWVRRAEADNGAPRSVDHGGARAAEGPGVWSARAQVSQRGRADLADLGPVGVRVLPACSVSQRGPTVEAAPSWRTHGCRRHGRPDLCESAAVARCLGRSGRGGGCEVSVHAIARRCRRIKTLPDSLLSIVRPARRPIGHGTAVDL
jgi:hypothetical protein